MQKYRQLTSDERYAIAALRRAGLSQADIARQLRRSPSTIAREVRRNRCNDGAYRPFKACHRTRGRRSRARRNSHFTEHDYRIVDWLLHLDWSQEQVSAHLRGCGLLSISHETIYVHVWRNKRHGGGLWQHLRQAGKKRRKRYGAYDSRGKLAGKRHISERPPEAETRKQVGHWEVDTVMGSEHWRNSVVTLVERATGFLVVGKLSRHCAADATARLIELISIHPGRVTTITADIGSEFHSYRQIEAATGVAFYFATPHHSWERGTNENTNGLIRQYLPKRTCFAHVTQNDCDAIAAKLNSRPRKRYRYRTPEECYARS